MPLRLTLRPKEKLFLNGAVLVNGDTRAELVILNDVAILREKEIMTEAAVDTVCKQVYFLIQLIYIDQPSLAEYQVKLAALLDELVVAVPTMLEGVERIRALVAQKDYYHAMKDTRKLIAIEKELLENAGKSN